MFNRERDGDRREDISLVGKQFISSWTKLNLLFERMNRKRGTQKISCVISYLLSLRHTQFLGEFLFQLFHQERSPTYRGSKLQLKFTQV